MCPTKLREFLTASYAKVRNILFPKLISDVSPCLHHHGRHLQSSPSRSFPAAHRSSFLLNTSFPICCSLRTKARSATWSFFENSERELCYCFLLPQGENGSFFYLLAACVSDRKKTKNWWRSKVPHFMKIILIFFQSIILVQFVSFNHYIRTKNIKTFFKNGIISLLKKWYEIHFIILLQRNTQSRAFVKLMNFQFF